MTGSDVTALKETVEREAELHPVEVDAVKHINDDQPGTTLRILETDAEDEADQVGFQVTKPESDMGRQVFNERLGDGFRALVDHLRNGDTDDSDSERQSSEDQSMDAADMSSDDPGDTGEQTEDAETKPNPQHQSPPTREVGTFSITTTVDEDSLEQLVEELDRTFEEITDEFVDEETVESNTDRIDELDERLSLVEEKLAVLGSFGDGG